MTDKRFSDYNEIVSSVDELRETLGEPLPAAVIKVIDHLDDVCRSYIDKSTFIVIASSSSGGEPDISPKGDPQGFVKVIDDKHLAIPDRPGNRRLDTFQNLLDNPQIAVIFLIPGKGETLRIKGEARIVRDLSLRETMAVNGRVPDYAVVIHVAEAMIHCPKCVVRSKLWQPDAWPDHSGTPSVAEAVVVHAELGITAEKYREQLEAADRTRLY
ncbi:MAG: MSMEG_1061 family FMN-dependent PPOX-type flavoprotein [Candidatus Rariloculaceae bacterium]